MDYAVYIPEILTGLILLGFAWSFRSWSYVVKDSSTKILDRIESLGTEFHEYKVMVENRVTKLETKHDSLQRQVDRITYVSGTNGTASRKAMESMADKK